MSIYIQASQKAVTGVYSVYSEMFLKKQEVCPGVIGNALHIHI